MITKKLKQRLESVRSETLPLYDSPDYTIPVKITINPGQDTGVEVKVTGKGIGKKRFGAPSPSIDEFIQELQSQRVQKITFHSEENNYVLAALNVSQIKYFLARPYVKEIDDDTPMRV